MTREQVNLVSPCIEIIGQVRYRRGWNLSKILEAKKKRRRVLGQDIGLNASGASGMLF